jgi:hypothetical protein
VDVSENNSPPSIPRLDPEFEIVTEPWVVEEMREKVQKQLLQSNWRPRKEEQGMRE